MFEAYALLRVVITPGSKPVGSSMLFETVQNLLKNLRDFVFVQLRELVLQWRCSGLENFFAIAHISFLFKYAPSCNTCFAITRVCDVPN